MSPFRSLDLRDAVSPGLDQGPGLKATTTVLLVLATVFVGLRFSARYLIGTLYGWDDWIMVAALGFSFVTGGVNYAMIASGLGRDVSTLTNDQLVQFFKLLLAFECIYVTGVALVKISVLFMYLRIFPSKPFRVGAAIIGATVIAWWIAVVLVCIFQCSPIEKAWAPWIDGKCIDLKTSFTANAIPNIATDVAILCMPIRPLLKLQVNIIQKISIIFIFLLGSFVLFASIYRFWTIMRFDPTNTTWTLAVACTWCVVEVCCGAISGCLPTLRPLMIRVSSQFNRIPGSKYISTIRSGRSTSNATEATTVGSTGLSQQRRITDASQTTVAHDSGLGMEMKSAQYAKKTAGSGFSDEETPQNTHINGGEDRKLAETTDKHT